MRFLFSGEGVGKIGLVVRPRSIERKQGTVEVEILEITENTEKKRKKEEDQNVKRSFNNFRIILRHIYSLFLFT